MQIRTTGSRAVQVQTVPSQQPLQQETPFLPAQPVEDAVASNRVQRLRETADAIRQAFPGIDLRFTEFGSMESLQGYAQAAGAGLHMAVSGDFLEWMSQDAASFQEGMDFLQGAFRELCSQALTHTEAHGAGVVIGENGEIDYWTSLKDEDSTFQKMLKELEEQRLERKKRQEEREKAKNRKLLCTKKIGYSASRDLSRLAKVSTVADVKKLISKVYARKVSIGGNSQYDKDDVRMTMGQMDSVIRRARTKIKNLEEEAIMEAAKKKADKKRQQDRSLRIQMELKKKRTARHSREYAQVHEHNRWMPDFLRPRSPEEERLEQEQRMSLLAEAGLTSEGAVSPTGEASADPAAQAAAQSAGAAVSVNIAGAGINIVV